MHTYPLVPRVPLGLNWLTLSYLHKFRTKNFRTEFV